MSTDRLVVKFAGESGQGINTLGEILSKSVKDSGFYNFAYREYPSLIRGGVASYQIDISGKQIMSSYKHCDILTLLNDTAKDLHLKTVRKNGIVIHGTKELELTEEEKEYVNKNSIRFVSLDTTTMALEAGGIKIMANMVLMGFIWRLLSLKTKPLEEIVKERFKENLEEKGLFDKIPTEDDVKNVDELSEYLEKVGHPWLAGEVELPV